MGWELTEDAKSSMLPVPKKKQEIRVKSLTYHQAIHIPTTNTIADL
jgi:hypothetical protein